ncbi:MAG: hypothetical protein WAS01_01750 [Nostocoides sp.]
MRSRWQAVGDVWYLCRLARPPGVRRVGLFVVAFAASGAAALPMVLASSASALPEGRVSADAPAGLIVVRVLASPPTPPLAR